MKSEVKSTRGRKGTGYQPQVLYTYQIADRHYSSTRVEFGDMKNTGRKWAESIVNDFPANKEVRVYYDPNDPGYAALVTGVQGSELFMLVFMTPFNLIALAIWWGVGAAIHQRFRKPAFGGIQLTRSHDRVRVRMYDVSPLAAALLSIGGLSFVSIFIVGFATDMNPSMAVAIGMWVFLLGSGVAIALWRYRKTSSGRLDLHVTGAGQVILPCNNGRKDPVALPLSEIREVRIKTEVTSSGRGRSSTSYAPTIIRADGREEVLAKWYDRTKADGLAEWLEEQRAGAALPPKRVK